VAISVEEGAETPIYLAPSTAVDGRHRGTTSASRGRFPRPGVPGRGGGSSVWTLSEELTGGCDGGVVQCSLAGYLVAAAWLTGVLCSSRRAVCT